MAGGEQKEMISRSHAVVRELTSELEAEKSQSKAFAEELAAYKVNSAILDFLNW